VGSLKFYEREEIKDALALLALLVNPHDEVAFRRVINKPARGIGSTTLDKILDAAYAPQGFPPQGSPAEGGLLSVARSLSLSAKAQAGVEFFARFMEKARALLDSGVRAGTSGGASVQAATPVQRPFKSAASPIRAGEGLSVCTASLILDSGLAEYHSANDEINGYQRLGNLQELVNAASLYSASLEGLAEFLEHIELDRSIEENKDKANLDSVTLITLHNTKGLEFKRVILTGLEQGIFPRDDKEGDDLEEERRLFYVGATRAMDELYLCSCAFRRMYGRTSPMLPSRFLHEVDKSSIRVIAEAPAGFGGKKTGSFLNGGGLGRNNAAFNNSAFVNVPPPKVSSDGRWKTGDRVFHDDQGYGAVIAVSETEEGPVVKVRFDNGYETSFLSLYQSGNFTKMGKEQ
jgi:DNA helicase-2/ATP-dependent DNA helicase PcrA